jgi:ABC-type phosphate transport system substrate-binding protein
MKKTSDLVNEMLTEAKKAWLVAIAVGFENETKFVFSSQRHPLEELNQLVQKGGSPIGLLRFDNENATIQGSYRPFEEYENEEWVKKYLAGLLDHAGDIIASSQHKYIFPAAS